MSLTHLKGLWWVAHVDAAHKHSDIEFGGAYCTVVASTMDLIHQYSSGYVEVTQGPFDTAEEAQAAMPSW
ncbi:MAG: hypothetical protein J0L58_07650 [Burkholderiales bacterium]|nr:hypothetical protein [Burkholderiales bacterium]